MHQTQTTLYPSTLLQSTLCWAYPKLVPCFQVRVQPRPTISARGESQNRTLPGQGQPDFDAHATTDTNDEGAPPARVPHQLLRDAALTNPGSGEPLSERSRVGVAISTEMGGTSPSTPTAPLHDTQTHLRAVHALLDSLPPEYQSDVRQQQKRQQPPALSPGPKNKSRSPRGHFPTPTVAHPLPSEEPLAGRLGPDGEGAMNGKRTTFRPSISGSGDVGESSTCGRDDTGVCGSDGKPSSLPEIRRLLSSLDRVDQRLMSLASPGGDRFGEVRNPRSDATAATAATAGGGDGIYNSGTSRNVPPLRDPLAGGGRSSCCRGETGVVDDLRPRFADGADEQAATKIQGAWRATSMRRRHKAALLAQQEVMQAASRRERARTESARTIQVAYRRAQARHRARAELEERRRWAAQQRRRAEACSTLARAWRTFECRRRGKRELTKARARAAAAAAEHARKTEQAARAAIVIQKLLRGGLSRQAARRLRGARQHSGGGGGNSGSRDAWSVGALLLSSGSTATEASSNANGNGENGESTGSVPDERVLLRATTGADDARPLPSEPSSMTPTTHCVVVAPSAARTSPTNTTASAAPRPLPPSSPPAPAPSTFYNQLSQDPRRRFPIPEAHVASALSREVAKSPPSTGVAMAESRGVAVKSKRSGPPPADTAGRGVAGVVRPPRFADLETARIARIMKGNLQHWAGVRSSVGECSYSSSDDFDL